MRSGLKQSKHQVEKKKFLALCVLIDLKGHKCEFYWEETGGIKEGEYETVSVFSFDANATSWS